MDFDPKKLKQLADACRKAGITTFKGFGMEFTLSDEAPQPKRRGKAAQEPPKPSYTQGEIETDTLADDALLMWSVGTGEQEENVQ